MGFHVGIRFRFTEIDNIDFSNAGVRRTGRVVLRTGREQDKFKSLQIIKIESIKVELTPRLGFAKRKSFKRDSKCKVKCNQVENTKTYLFQPPPYSGIKVNDLIKSMI